MADPLALYSSVMGKLWEDERIRGKAAARIDARIAGRRQGRQPLDIRQSRSAAAQNRRALNYLSC